MNQLKTLLIAGLINISYFVFLKINTGGVS